MNSLVVFIGGGLGSLMRYGVSLALGEMSFPLATFAANIIGCFLIGAFGSASVRFAWGETTRLLLMAGLCGGFTTFSTFSRESLALAQAGRWCAFVAYAVGSVSLGIAAVALGYWTAKQ